MNAIALEKRLIQFAVDTINLCEDKKNNFAALHLSKQLIRSSTSVPLNSGEARGGASNRDFAHKMKICLKELRECLNNLKIQEKAVLINNKSKLAYLIKENDELISIFVSSIKTTTLK